MHHCPPPLMIPPWLLMVILIVHVGISNSSGITNDETKTAMEVPDSPTHISVVTKTYTSVILKWLEQKSTDYPTQDLVYKIRYKSQWDNSKRWRTVVINNIFDNTSSNPIKVASFPITYWRHCDFFYVNVTELKYPFSYYEFRVFSRFLDADNENEWSIPGSIVLKTKATVPKRPPFTDIGSFESERSNYSNYTRSIIIYWQNIPNIEKNGKHFMYRVFCTPAIFENEEHVIYSRNESRTNHVKFNNLDMDKEFKFNVYSANEIGMSKEFSTVFVPALSEDYGKHMSLTKMLINKDQGVYELSWKNTAKQLLTNDNNTTFYSLFWCEFERHHPDHCNGHFNWTHVPITRLSHNVTVKYPTNTYKFAISANSRISLKNGQENSNKYVSRSSGMIWDSCNLLLNKTYTKMESVWIAYISSTFFQLMWTLDCTENIGKILGYRMNYCPTVSLNNTDCTEPMINKTVNGEIINKKRTFAFVRNLQPYTTYLVRITMLTDNGEILPSDPMIETTREGAPNSRSLFINFTDITQTSFNMQWSPPKLTNGNIRYYRLTYYRDMNDDEYFNNENSTDSKDMYFEEQALTKYTITVRDTKYFLDGLDAYTTYVFTMVACTSICSESSYPFEVRTAVGNPKTVVNPFAKYGNTSSVVISWGKPLIPAGPIDYYKILMVHYVGTNSTTMEKYRFTPIHLIPSGKRPLNPIITLIMTNATTLRINIPDCAEPKNSPQTCYIGIQAINNNTLNANRPFYGDWSRTGILTCGM